MKEVLKALSGFQNKIIAIMRSYKTMIVFHYTYRLAGPVGCGDVAACDYRWTPHIKT